MQFTWVTNWIWIEVEKLCKFKNIFLKCVYILFFFIKHDMYIYIYIKLSNLVRNKKVLSNSVDIIKVVPGGGIGLGTANFVNRSMSICLGGFLPFGFGFGHLNPTPSVLGRLKFSICELKYF
ncbi:Protein of unknown function [Gryllus bimaculatus]|nr:Protein of unknown function [Gryllus bimaculatus]